MNKMDLIEKVAEEADLSKTRAGELVNIVFRAIEGALRASEEVRLVGFGTFAAIHRGPTPGRNPRTGAEIAIAASSTVRFKPGKALKDGVHQG